MDEDNKLTKEEEKYAKYLRFNCPTKVGMLNSNEYNFFNGLFISCLTINQ